MEHPNCVLLTHFDSKVVYLLQDTGAVEWDSSLASLNHFSVV